MKRTKTFDAVRNMREIRDRLSAQFAGMSFEEQRRYIEQKVNQPGETAQGSRAQQKVKPTTINMDTRD